MKVFFRQSVILGLLIALGCGKSESPRGGKTEEKATPVAEKKEDDHGGWWCDEHGMPEEVCAQCNAKLAAEFKKKGDWCKEHHRPDSQCFVCHPELKEKFAAMYRAKYGKEPPPTEDEKDKEKKHK